MALFLVTPFFPPCHQSRLLSFLTISLADCPLYHSQLGDYLPWTQRSRKTFNLLPFLPFF
jgi:hypothetical protein